ncbi:YecR family lipoprotein [Arsenophonus nasoniae]|uniref:YecR family lipoprotein n=1 Tax=Arsenophonus nasoniae TaxID=638 RepID=A0AA95GD44_9GAMM|nr:YecR family lipoprotein [Arsenophonus nasoniae]WGL96552.1 YecR family lipoprotein [Arsenophonus nasoniae]
MFIKKFFISIFIILLSACTVNKEMYAIGGSKADGTIELAYDFGMFETPKIDFQKASQLAIKKCSVWGYKNAEAFGGQRTRCTDRNGFGDCVRAEVTVPFQCTE